MGRIPAAVAAAVVVVLLLSCSYEVRGKETEDVKKSLVQFLATLAGGGNSGQATAHALGWNESTDPCPGVTGNGNASNWGKQVVCFNNSESNSGKIKLINLKSQNLNGTIDASLLCAAPALRVVSLQNNALSGGLPAGVSACSGLTHLYVDGNRLSGSLPSSLGQFRKLLVLYVSSNNFSGELPASLSQIPGLVRFLANDNHFEGAIPDFDLDKFKTFNVSNNNLTGPIPEHLGSFDYTSFANNAAGMCGKPLFPECPPSPSSGESKSRNTRRVLMYLGYVLLGSVIVGFVLYKLCSRKKNNRLGKKARRGGGKDTFDSSSDPTTMTTTVSKSAYSLPASAERSAAVAGGAPSTSLVVLRRSGTASVTSTAAAAAAKDLRFEDLLKSPAELLGRGRYGSSYKVVVPGGAALAVKRVKDATVTDDEFRRRMERVSRARHPAVLPPLAFYCAAQEKLVVYEFQSNGSLHKQLHGMLLILRSSRRKLQTVPRCTPPSYPVRPKRCKIHAPSYRSTRHPRSQSLVSLRKLHSRAVCLFFCLKSASLPVLHSEPSSHKNIWFALILTFLFSSSSRPTLAAGQPSRTSPNLPRRPPRFSHFSQPSPTPAALLVRLSPPPAIDLPHLPPSSHLARRRRHPPH